ncbi:calumenin-A-like [Clytia hemisphaerica]|uniref:Reticulocalbin-3 n=1 Tax=Clytia hemisphaerica TaxID=252671 RepID=A0A7M5WXX3_9CNID
MNIQLVYNLIILMVLRNTRAKVEEHKISDEEHFHKDGKHDTSYDHDAFLGKGHGHDFDGLEPQEAKRRLREMLKKVDTDKDGFISFEELRDWVDKQRISYMWETLDTNIRQNDDDHDGLITWIEYKHSQFGKWEDAETEIDAKLQARINKSEKKFKLADTNGDGKLSRDEFAFFRHPEESRDEKLQDIAVDEVIDDMDQNGDRKIDQEEFLGQYVDDANNPPDWVLEDRKHFRDKLDKNKNGMLEREEMKAWVLPNRDDTLKETKHLIADADDNEDGRLSFDEVVDHFQTFVGSTATDHGQALRDEL